MPKSADGPRIPTHLILFNWRPQTMVTKRHPQSVLRELMEKEEVAKKEDDEKKRSKNEDTQSVAVDWALIGPEVGNLIRVCRIVSAKSTPQELYQVGEEEYPDFDPF